jgi:1,4-alpha-glucan branching enzyme
VVGDLNGGVRLVTAINTNINNYYARKRSTLGSVVTFTAPGIPMLFQGQEMLENQQFSDTRPVDWSKTVVWTNIVRLYKDLTRLRRNLDGVSPGLKGDQISFLQIDNSNKLLAYRRWKSGAPSQDVVVVANFANATQNNNALSFPRAGNWYVQFNSDLTTYGADYENIGPAVVTAAGLPASAGITVGPYSVLILSQTPPPLLSIVQSDSVITVSWPNYASGWLLDSSPALSGPLTIWTQVPPTLYQSNGVSTFLNLTSPPGSSLFRLRKP